MLGDRVKVLTRFYRGDGKTLVLDFGAGLHGRPMMRDALSAESLLEPGTDVGILIHGTGEVEIEFEEVARQTFTGLLGRQRGRDSIVSPQTVLAQAFPAADVDISLALHSSKVRIVRANDWLIICQWIYLEGHPAFTIHPTFLIFPMGCLGRLAAR